MSTGFSPILSEPSTNISSLSFLDRQKLQSMSNLTEQDVYSNRDKSQYENFIQDEENNHEENSSHPKGNGGVKKPANKPNRFQYSAPQDILDKDMKSGPEEEIFENPRKIADREDKYLQRKKLRQISPERHDFFRDADKTPDINSRTYQDIMAEQKIENERQEVLRKIAKQKEDQNKRMHEKKPTETVRFKPASTTEDKVHSKSTSVSTSFSKSDWDNLAGPERGPQINSKWDTPSRPGFEESTPTRRHRWDMTPHGEHDATPGRMLIGETPTPGRFLDQTPGRFGETPTPKRGVKGRWDDKTPLIGGQTPTNFIGLTPTMTPGLSTPTLTSLTPERLQMLRWEKEIDERNRPLTDEELDQVLPIDGYEVIFYFWFNFFYFWLILFKTVSYL